MQALLEDDADLEQPENLMQRVKTNLGIDRDIDAEIEISTERYNVAVCWSVSLAMMATLPPELRDMVTDEVVGADVASELMESWHRTSNFKLELLSLERTCDEDDPDHRSLQARFPACATDCELHARRYRSSFR